MPSTIKLDVIADILLKIGKINDGKVLKQLQNHLNKLNIEPIEIDAILDPKDAGQALSQIDKLDKAIGGLGSAAEGIGDVVKKKLEAAAKTPEGKEFFKTTSLENTVNEVSKALKNQILGVREGYKDLQTVMKQSVFDKEGGRDYSEGIKQLNRLIAGTETLTKKERKAAEEAAKFAQQRADALRKIYNANARLERSVQIPYFKDGEPVIGPDGNQKTRPIKIPGVSFPEIASAADEWERFAKSAAVALDPKRVDAMNDKLDAMRNRVGGQKKGSLGYDINSLKRSLGKIDLDQSGLDKFGQRLNQLAEERKKLFKEFKEVDALTDLDEKERRTAQAFAEQARQIKELDKIQREVDADRRRADAEAVGARIESEARIAKRAPAARESLLGAELFKGRDKPEVVVKGVKNLDDAANSVSHLRDKFIEAGRDYVSYARDLDKAGKATDDEFKRRQQRYVEAEALLKLAQKQEAKLIRRQDPDVQRREAKKAVQQSEKEVRDAKAAQDKERRDAARAAQIARGKEVVDRYRDTAGGLTGNVKNIADMEAAVASLADQHKRAADEAEKYNAQAKKSPERQRELANAVSRANTELEKAKNHLRDLQKEAAKEGTKRVAEDLRKTSKSATELASTTSRAITKLNQDLRKARDDLPVDLYESLRKNANDYRNELERINKTRADAAGVGNEQEQIRNLEKFRQETEAVNTAVKERSAELVKQLETQQQLKQDRERLDRETLQRRGDELVRETAKKQGISAPSEKGRLPIEAIGAAVGALGVGDALGAKQLEATIDKQLLDVESERRDILSDSKKLHDDVAKKKFESLDAEQDALNVEKERAKQKRKEAEAENARVAKDDVESLSKAQKEYARQKFGINIDEVRELDKGLNTVKRGIAKQAGDLRSQMRAMRDELGEPAARANPKYQELNKTYKELGQRLGVIRRLGREVGEELLAVGSATSPEQIARQRFARREIASDIIERSGGVAGLATGVRKVPKEEIGQLPLVREELQERLATRQAKQADLIAQGVSRHSEQYKNLNKEIYQTEKAISNVNTRLKGFYTVSAQIGALARQFARYGLGYAALYQALYGVRQLIGGVVELDSALISIRAVVQATDKEMTTIEKSIKRVALTTQFTTGQIASAAQVLAQAGVAAKDFPNALTAVAAFASATESSIQISADLISSFRNIFKDLDDLAIANQLTRAVNISKLTAEDLKTIISLSAQMADSYNLASEQYLSAVSTLRNAGIKASTVATGLRQALIEIFSPDTKTIKILQKRAEQLGEDTGADQLRQRFFGFSQARDPLLEVLRELRRQGFGGSGASTFSGRTFDVRAENAINGLIKNLDEYVQSQAEVVFGNAAIVSSQTQMESLSASAKNLGAALIATSHNLTEDLLPGIESLIDGLTDAIQGLSDFNSRLKSEIGTSFGDLFISGALAGAVALRKIPKDFGIIKGAGFVGGTALAGGTAAYGAQNLAQEAGLGETATKFASDAAAVATGALIGNLGGAVDTVRKKLGKYVPVAVAAKSGQLLEKTKTLGTTISKALGPIGKAFGALLGFFKIAGGPFGWALSLATLVGSASALVYRWIGTGRSAETMLKEANKRAQDAQAELDLFNQQASQFRPSEADVGYEAPEGTIARSSEDLTNNLTEFEETLSNLFGVSADVSKKKTSEIVTLLRRINELAPEAGPERTRQFKLLEEVTGADFTSTPLAQQSGDELVSQISDLDNTSAGLFKGLQKTYRYAIDNLGKLKPEENLNDAFALFVKSLADQEGFRAEMLGLADASVEEVDDFMTKLINGFVQTENYLNIEADKLETTNAAKDLELENTLNYLNTAFTNYRDKLNYLLENIKIPETPEEFERFEKRKARDEAVRQEALEEGSGFLEFLKTNAINSYRAIFTPEVPLLESPVTRAESSVRASRQAETTAEYQYFKDRREVEKQEEKELANTIITLRQLIQLRKENNAKADQAIKNLEKGLTYELPPAASRALKSIGGIETIEGDETPQEIAARLIRLDLDKGVINYPGDKRDLRNLKNVATSAFQGAIAEKSKVERPPLFEETYEFLELRKELSAAREEVARFKNAKNFDKLQDALIKLRDIELKLADENIKHLKKYGPGKDATEAQKVAHERKILQEQERRRQVEEQFEAERLRFRSQQFRLEQKRAKEEISAFKKLAEDKTGSPYFSAFGDILALEPAFQAAVEQHVQALEKELRDELGTGKEADAIIARRVEAFRAEHRNLIEFSDAIKKATEATGTYNEALATLTAANAVGTSQNAGLEIIKRDYGINAPPEERRTAVSLEANAQKTALKSNLKAYELVSAQLAQAQLEQLKSPTDPNAASQVAELTKKLALLEVQLQENVDRMAELRSIARGINLDLLGELNKGFSPQGILSDLRRQTEEEVSSLGDTIRKGFEDAFDGVSDVITDAVFGDLEGDFLENLDNIVRDVFRQMAKDIVKTAVKTALLSSLEAVVPQQFQKFINPQQQAAGTAVFPGAVTLPGVSGPVRIPGAQGTAPLFPSATGIPALAGDKALAKEVTKQGDCAAIDPCLKSLFEAIGDGTQTEIAKGLEGAGGVIEEKAQSLGDALEAADRKIQESLEADLRKAEGGQQSAYTITPPVVLDDAVQAPGTTTVTPSPLAKTDQAITESLEADLQKAEGKQEQEDLAYTITEAIVEGNEEVVSSVLDKELQVPELNAKATQMDAELNASQMDVTLNAKTIEITADEISVGGGTKEVAPDTSGLGGFLDSKLGRPSGGGTSSRKPATSSSSDPLKSLFDEVKGIFKGLFGGSKSGESSGGSSSSSTISSLFSSIGGFFSSGVSNNYFGLMSSLGLAKGGVISRAGGGLLDRLRGSEKGSAVQQNFESEKSEQRKMLGDALEDKLKEEGILKRGMGGMMRLVRRSRGGPMDIPLGQAIRGAHGKGGIIKGPGTGTSDSIPGVIVDSSGRPQRGILVSNEEAILNAKATAKLGKPTIDWLNTNADKLASGGMVNAGLRKVHEATQSVVGGSRKIMNQDRERAMDMDQLREVMMSAMATQEPAKMKLEVSDSALNRTLKDYVESYFADVVAMR